MGDPTRLLSAHSDAEALERALLESLENVPPPDPRERDAIWGALAVQLAAVGAASAAGTAAAAGGLSSSMAATGAASSTSAAPPALAAAKLAGSGAVGGLSALVPKTLLAKLVLLGALGGASGGALWLQSRPTAPAPASQPRATPAPVHVAPIAAPRPAEQLALPAAPAPTLERPTPRARSTPHAPKPQSDSLVRESQLLTSARAALREGDLTSAARLLRRLESDFAHSELQQERELLQIELLSARGQDEAATARARRFVAAHPESPHSARLVRFLR